MKKEKNDPTEAAHRRSHTGTDEYKTKTPWLNPARRQTQEWTHRTESLSFLVEETFYARTGS